MAPVRFGLVGLGEMGRHHARVLQQVSGVDLVGIADPADGPHGMLGTIPVHRRLDDLIAADLDAAVVAAPSIHHEEIALRLADAGVHVLIEKPMAPTSAAAIGIRDGFRRAGLIAAVGHVERFNPAASELRRRLANGELGQVFSISTRRVGPYPLRVRDVGVVMDLAIHDIDMAMWLAGPIQSLTAQTAHRMGRNHEDLIVAVGRTTSGCVLSIDVNWLTPNKERTVSVVGERGAFVADLLRSELCLHANAEVPTEWGAMQRLKGVSVGDMTRFALLQREPLVVQAEQFRDVVLGHQSNQLATMDEGIAAVQVAEELIGAHTNPTPRQAGLVHERASI